MSTVFLIPSVLQEEGLDAIPSYILPVIKECQVFFVESERTTRRFFKQLWKEMVIDDFEWYNMSDTLKVSDIFLQKIKEGKNIGIVSEAGCPGIADPGQALVAIAQQLNVDVRPLVGPNSIVLALMASGMNGQQFRFVGYLPIDNQQRVKAIKELEAFSAKNDCTAIFIETPYRNNQLLETLVKHCDKTTQLCIAVELTGKTESVRTRSIGYWQKNIPDIHKRPAIFLLYAGH